MKVSSTAHTTKESDMPSDNGSQPKICQTCFHVNGSFSKLEANQSEMHQGVLEMTYMVILVVECLSPSTLQQGGHVNLCINISHHHLK